MSNYNRKCKKVLGFDSKLECRWFQLLRNRFRNVKYIGDMCNVADISVEGGILIEIKPFGDQFVSMAHQRARRYRRAIIIIEGEGYYAKWHVSTLSGELVKIDPPKYGESVRQCIERNGFTFVNESH